MRDDDFYSAMRPVLLVGVALAWNVPVVLFVLRYGFTPPAGAFESLAILQAVLLAAVFVAVASSGRLHRLVFRPGTPDAQFRRPLFSGAALALCIAVVIWLTTFALR